MGVLAAAGIVALDTMIDRLADDHANARRLAEGLAQIPGISLNSEQLQTNIVFVEVDPPWVRSREFIGKLSQEGVKVSYPGERRFRMVTHRHITSEDVDIAINSVAEVSRELRSSRSGSHPEGLER